MPLAFCYPSWVGDQQTVSSQIRGKSHDDGSLKLDSWGVAEAPFHPLYIYTYTWNQFVLSFASKRRSFPIKTRVMAGF